MQWVGSFLLVSFFLTAPVLARHEVQLCGTTAETANERLFLHRQSVRARARTPLSPRLLAEPLPRANRNIGDIAIIEDTNGVVVRQNQFNLDQKTLQFIPTRASASHYRYEVIDQGYDAPAAASGAPVAALDDDDARAVTLPWAFPFFGASYTAVFVNSDGNLTFGESDSSSSERSLGRVTSGPPRISPLFDDLDPSRTAGGVRVLADAARVVVSWVAVPEWQDSGVGARQTFQASLYRDGRIAFSYSGVSAESAVVGVAPGGLEGGVTLVDFRNDASAEYAAAIAERFGNALTIDIVTAAQKFYETHEDAYDYLVIYNNMNIDAQPGAVAYESTVRSRGTGFGVVPRDDGRQYGSASRLLAVLNMGQLGQYPTDPNALVQKRATAGDTPLTTIGHEAGHLFLARASVADPNDPTARPMLGFQNAHWSFVFNSEASLMEGERILDKGPEANPRFLTTDIAQGFAPLDQYLMGWRRPQDVPDMFLVTGAPSFLQPLHPLRGYSFHGQRRDISIAEIIQNMGRRTPDSTVAQRRFRFAFILVAAQGAEPSAADIAKIERFRQQFEPFFADAATGNASAQTSLRQALLLSLSPASGIVAGASAQGLVSVSRPGAAPLTVHFQAPNGYARFPESITIPAGAKTATFSYSGVSTGVEDVAAVPDDPAYETAFARVQVAGANVLRLRAVSGDRQIASSAGPLPEPIVVRLTDDNGLTYSGARVMAAASSGGSATPPAAVSGADGLASFVWSPGSAATNELQLSVEGLPSVSLLLQAGRAVPVATAVVNAASFERGVAAGAIESIFGANLAGGRVLLNGTAAPVLYASDTQINFYVPAETPLGAARISVVSPTGAEATTDVTVAAVHPGIFPGAAIHAGTVLSAVTTPTRAGQFIEIYCTGLGPTRTVNGLQQTVVRPTVFFGATPVQPVFSGLAPGYQGLYQVNVQVPAGLAAGMQDLVLTTSQLRSNQIQIAVQ